MYVNAFLLGVVSTIGAEAVAFILMCVIVAMRQNRK